MADFLPSLRLPRAHVPMLLRRGSSWHIYRGIRNSSSSRAMSDRQRLAKRQPLLRLPAAAYRGELRQVK